MSSGKVNLLETGISIIDEAWGGFYRGGTYMLIGPRKSGRTTLGLQFAVEGIKNKETCLYFTSMRPKDLTILAASIDFDLQTHMNNGDLIVVKVTPPTDVYETGNPDGYLVEYLNDIVGVIEQYHPHRMVFDELTYFIGFENMNLLQQAFLKTIESIEDKNTTSLYILGEPATPFAQTIVDSIVQYSTAIVFLQKNQSEGNVHGGRVTITPNIGHTEGQFSSDYSIEPYKGVVFDFYPPGKSKPNVSPESNINSQFDPNSSFNDSKHNQQNFMPEQNNISSKFKPISDFDSSAAQPTVTIPNLYSMSEFSLILNNQIALFKSTGQQYSLIALKLDDAAEKQGILTINQLQNAVRLSCDRKDKICVTGSTIIVLLGKGDNKSLNEMVMKVKSNLPNSDPNALKLAMSYIYGYTIHANDNIQNAESLLQELI
ncbi:MAG: hypothetical protein IAE91_12305 [Ignavibacteriaceae bacterium]|nr:hypothetical protein [Ignavibacteriaceae bacterium]